MRGAASLVIAALGVAKACRQNDDPAAAEELLARVEADDYRSWARAPGHDARTPSAAPHSQNVEIFVNDVVAQALGGEPASEWPVGSIIAKDGYADSGELELVALMEKREEGWFWAEYDADGAPLYSGTEVGICVDCHDAGGDFVRAFPLP